MRIYKNIHLAEDIDGFLTNREGQLLYSLAHACPPLSQAVEIGSWKGKSTIWLAQGFIDNGKPGCIYAIDPHTGSSEHQLNNASVWTFDQFKENIKKSNVGAIIKPIVKTSSAAVNETPAAINLLFIDGAHEYEFVNEDYALYAPRLVEGGFIAFHDTPWPGVQKVISHVFTTDGFKNVFFTDSLMIATKCAHLGKKDTLKNKWMLSLNESFQQACRSQQPKILRKMWKDGIKLLRFIVYHL